MRLPRITVRRSTVLVLLVLFLIDGSVLSLLPSLAALIHEAGHLLMLRLFSVSVSELEITLLGAELRCAPHELSDIKSAAVFLAGPTANFISALVIFLMPEYPVWLGFFAVCSAILAFLNLLPIRTLDGGCVVWLLLMRAVPWRAERIMNVISGATLFFVWIAAVYMLLFFGGNISLYIFSVYMFVTLYITER